MIQEVLTIQFTYLRDTPDPRTHQRVPSALNSRAASWANHFNVFL